MSEADLIRGRRHAIYALTGFCAFFFVGGIIASYAVAARYGYGTGIGDGFLKDVPVAKGNGFFGDLAVFTGNFVVILLVLFFWQWLLSRLEAVSVDDPAPIDDGADLTKDENWYYVSIPRLRKVLVAIAAICTAGVSICMALTLPVVLIRYGW